MISKDVIIGMDCDLAKLAAVAINYKTAKIVKSIFIKREDRWVGGLYDMVEELIRWISLELNKDIKMVAIEDYGGGRQSTRNFSRKGEVVGCIKYELFKSNIPIFFTASTKKKKEKVYNEVTMMSPSQIKKYIGVSSSHGKTNQAFLWAYKRYGIEFDNDNILDAYVLARIIRNVLTIEEKKKCPDKVNKKQKEVLITLLKGRKLHFDGIGNYCCYGMRKKHGNVRRGI